MAIVLRYVDTHGLVKEIFVGLVHVMETSSSSLKASIYAFFAKHKLSLMQLRGQGYDGASNMRGEFNGLKAKILEENNSAYYVHCFAHQLQLVVVAVASNHLGVVNFFDKLSTLMNVVLASCKRTNILREKEKERVANDIRCGLLTTGSGLNQELSLTRPGDTRWNSHYRTLLRLEVLFPSVLSVLDYVKKEGTNGSTQNKAIGLKRYLNSFDCVFLLHLMSHILRITDVLSRALQRKDQDILEAVSMVNSTKRKLQEYRLNGFERLLEKVSLFCVKHGIKLLKMDEICANKRCQRDNITNQHYYEFESFNTILDLIIIEFGDRFSEASTKLLDNMAALNPCASFSNFDVSKLVKLSEMYPYDFDDNERKTLLHELELYHDNVQHDVRFVNLNSITALAMLMVETRKHLSYPLVYRLLKLALVLPVATATVERCFSSMKLVTTDLRNRIGDMFFNSCLICSIEREALANVTNEQIIERFLNMGTRKGQL
uniref:zinc finger MYM-type protein 1-like n=1 Tax=Erigeron canadensis TaxID=72917 RepID=UPI001CB98EF0|nr:zinc finger MYM-type protein 1-like [Erigeron canadensis]